MVCEHTSALAHMHTSLERSEVTDVLEKNTEPMTSMRSASYS